LHYDANCVSKKESISSQESAFTSQTAEIETVIAE